MTTVSGTLLSSFDRPIKDGNYDFYQTVVNKAIRFRSNANRVKLGFHSLEKRNGGMTSRLASGILYDISLNRHFATYTTARLEVIIPLGLSSNSHINSFPLVRIPAYLIGAEGIGIPFAKVKHNRKVENIFHIPEGVELISDELLSLRSSGALPEIMFSYFIEVSDNYLLELEQLWNGTNQIFSWANQKKRLEMFRQEAKAIQRYKLEEKLLIGDYKKIQDLLCSFPPKCRILIESLTVATP